MHAQPRNHRSRRRLLLLALLLAWPTVLRAEPPREEPPREETPARSTTKVRAVFVTEPGATREIRELEIEDGRIRTVELGGSGPHYWVQRAFLGVELLTLTEELRRHFGAPTDFGLLVARVEEGSPAADAGVRVGDVLTAVDDRPVKTQGDVVASIRHRKAGDETRIRVVRGGKARVVSATLRERERTVVDLSRFTHGFEPGAVGEDVMVFHVDGKTANEVMEQLHGSRVRATIFDLKKREASLLQRLEALEKDFRELERELQAERRNRR